jgi:hypothetical protein
VLKNVLKFPEKTCILPFSGLKKTNPVSVSRSELTPVLYRNSLLKMDKNFRFSASVLWPTQQLGQKFLAQILRPRPKTRTIIFGGSIMMQPGSETVETMAILANGNLLAVGVKYEKISRGRDILPDFFCFNGIRK